MEDVIPRLTTFPNEETSRCIMEVNRRKLLQAWEARLVIIGSVLRVNNDGDFAFSRPEIYATCQQVKEKPGAKRRISSD